MIRNYLAVAFRLIRRHPGYSAINVVGLTVGLAATLLIGLFVADELSYDRYHEYADRIVRVTEETLDESGASVLESVLIDPGWAPLIEEELAEVERVVRLTPVGPVFEVDGRKMACGKCYFVDDGLFDVLSFDFLQGDPATALSQPRSIVLSRDRAESLFGSLDIVGRSLNVNGDDAFTVTGVYENLASNTHLPIDGLGTLSSFSWFGARDWDSPNYATYLRLAESADPAAVEEKLAGLARRHRGDEVASRSRLEVQDVRDIHLHSQRVGELDVNGSAATVRLLVVVALFILVIACINFVNLATARSSLRAREVGVRKATGAYRSQLIAQFLGESVLLVMLALVGAVMIVQAALPAFNGFTGKQVSLLNWGAAAPVLILIFVGLLTGVAAGAWPAFVLSSWKPVAALRGHSGRLTRGGRLRSSLVVVQFGMAITLVLGTTVVFHQLAYVEGRDLGYDRDDLLVLPVMWELRENFDPVKDRLLANRDVIGVAQSNPVPGSPLHTSIQVEAEVGDHLESATLRAIWADQGFFDTYGVSILAGRAFSDEFASDADTGFILNRSAVGRLGLGNPQRAIGAPLRVGGWRGQVIGVVEDVNFESLHQPIAPQVYYMDPRNYRAVTVRLRPGADMAEATSFLEREWALHDPGAIFSYGVLADRLDRLYEDERRLGQMIGLFAALALFVTVLGVLGLAAFAAERRTREIGIRKVFGASEESIVALLNRDVLRLVIFALVLASPLGLLAAGRWLDTFAYRVGVPWWALILVAVCFLVLTVATVSTQAVRAAKSDPVDALRYE